MTPTIVCAAERGRKTSRRQIPAGYGRLAEVALGLRPPAWALETEEGDAPIHDDGADPYLDLLATARAAPRTHRVLTPT